MRQIAVVVIICVAAFFAMPALYAHRFGDSAFAAGLVAYIGGPFAAGMAFKAAHPSLLPIALVLVLLCPVVYLVTDSMPVQFERSRDAYFLASFSSIVFISSTWLANAFRTRRWTVAVAAALGLSLASAGVLVLVMLVVYLE